MGSPSATWGAVVLAAAATCGSCDGSSAVTNPEEEVACGSGLDDACIWDHGSMSNKEEHEN